MKYLLNNLSNSDFCLNQNGSENLITYNRASKFGKTQYKSKLSNFYTAKLQNSYFSKKRDLKTIITKLKQINFSVENGFFIELLLVGLGFKVIRVRSKSMLSFELHFSHKLYFSIPEHVSIRCIKKKIVLFGIDKAQLITIAEQIKALRFPNTYKGKGIKYFAETIKLKPGKQR